MAHVALVITGLTGKRNASLELARRLQAEGHEVTYLCPVDVREVIEHHKFRYLQLPETNFHFRDIVYDKVRSQNWLKRLSFHWTHYKEHYAKGKNILHLGKYKDVFVNLKCEIALIDMEMHELIFAAHAAGVRTLLYSSWFLNRPQLVLPPLRSTILPKVGFSGSSLGILLAWGKEAAKTYARLVINVVMFKNYRRQTLKKYAKEVGFNTKQLVASNFPPLFSYTESPILTMAMPELEFEGRSYGNLTYIGPMVFQDRYDTIMNTDIEEKLGQLFQKREQGKKLIYCSFGSFKMGDTLFIKNLFAAVESQKDWMILLSLGKRINEEAIQPIPENVAVFDWLPQPKVLAHVDCSINHGGTHTVYECIHNKVPMLIYSGKHFDQNGTAARISYHGLGIMGDKDADSPPIIQQNLKKVLKDQRFKNRMTEIHSQYLVHREKKLTPVLERILQEPLHATDK